MKETDVVTPNAGEETQKNIPSNVDKLISLFEQENLDKEEAINLINEISQHNPKDLDTIIKGDR